MPRTPIAITLQSERSGHDLAIDGADGSLGEPALLCVIQLYQLAQKFLFALGCINFQSCPVLDFADDIDALGALIEEAKKLLVDGVDLVPNFFECHGR